MIDSKGHKIINFTKIEMVFLEVLLKKVGPHITDVFIIEDVHRYQNYRSFYNLLFFETIYYAAR